MWEERFGETRYVPLGAEAWESALKAAGLTADQVDQVAVTGMHGRAVKALARKLGVGDGALADDLGRARWARPERPTPDWCWPPCSSRPGPARWWPCVALADGADVLVFRTTEALRVVVGRPSRWPTRSPAAADLPYGKFLTWRGMVTPEPPRRPEPAAGLVLGRLAQRGVEVRLRRLPGPHLRGRPPAARPGSR